MSGRPCSLCWRERVPCDDPGESATEQIQRVGRVGMLRLPKQPSIRIGVPSQGLKVRENRDKDSSWTLQQWPQEVSIMVISSDEIDPLDPDRATRTNEITHSQLGGCALPLFALLKVSNGVQHRCCLLLCCLLFTTCSKSGTVMSMALARWRCGGSGWCCVGRQDLRTWSSRQASIEASLQSRDSP